jgi:uncharacterized protein (DUF4213/DUF364 family)
MSNDKTVGLAAINSTISYWKYKQTKAQEIIDEAQQELSRLIPIRDKMLQETKNFPAVQVARKVVEKQVTYYKEMMND